MNASSLPIAAFTTTAHPKMSARYAHVNTAQVLETLTAEGFEIAKSQAARVRDASTAEFARHVVTLRHGSMPEVGGVVPQALLRNSHDGSSGFQMMAGFYRLVCSNGLVIGQDFVRISIRHLGADLNTRVLDAARKVVAQMPAMVDQVARMQGTVITEQAARDFAAEAAADRFGAGWAEVVRDPADLLRPRRFADNARDLFTVYNVVQENVIKGGVRVVNTAPNARARYASSRAVTGLDRNLELNRGLWDRAVARLPMAA